MQSLLVGTAVSMPLQRGGLIVETPTLSQTVLLAMFHAKHTSDAVR